MTETVPVFGGSTGTITHDACTYRGVVLDKMEVTGPRGGKSILWRAAKKREYQISSWSHTKADAAK